MASSPYPGSFGIYCRQGILEVMVARDHGHMREICEEGLVMARALVRDGILNPWAVPNGYLIAVPKNSTKALMIFHLVRLNKDHKHKAANF